MNLHGAGGSLEQVGKIMLQLLLPFVPATSHAHGLATGLHGMWISKPTRRQFCWWSIPPSARR